MKTFLALTIISDDVPGIVETIADTVVRHDGNWLESSMSRLGGKFAGILLVEVSSDDQSALIQELESLGQRGIRITIESSDEQAPGRGESFELSLMAHDRPGIVEEISGLLAGRQVNVEQLQTHCERAPMSALAMFKAHAIVQLPEDMRRDDLVTALEALSGDLMVELQSTKN